MAHEIFQRPPGSTSSIREGFRPAPAGRRGPASEAVAAAEEQLPAVPVDRVVVADGQEEPLP